MVAAKAQRVRDPFLVINPFGVLPAFVAITGTHTASAQRKIALHAVLISFVVLVFFVIAGAFLLDQMGIPIRAFQISGGILLFLVALDMIRSRSLTDEPDTAQSDAAPRRLPARDPQDRRARLHADRGPAHG